MLAHLRTALFALGAVTVLIACSAQSPQTPAETATSDNRPSQEAAERPTPMPTPAPVGSTPPTSGPTPIASDTKPVPMPEPVAQAAPHRKPPPQMSDPLPPERMPGAVKLDRNCRTAADCTVKNLSLIHI